MSLIHSISALVDGQKEFKIPLPESKYRSENISYFGVHKKRKVEIASKRQDANFFYVTLHEGIAQGDSVDFYGLQQPQLKDLLNVDTSSFNILLEELQCLVKYYEATIQGSSKSYLSKAYELVLQLQKNNGIIIIPISDDNESLYDYQDLRQVVEFCEGNDAVEQVVGKFLVITNPYVHQISVKGKIGFESKKITNIISAFKVNSDTLVTLQDIQPVYRNPRIRPQSTDSDDLKLDSVNYYYLQEESGLLNRFKGALKPVRLKFSKGSSHVIRLFLPVDIDINLVPLSVVGVAVGGMFIRKKTTANIDGLELFRYDFIQQYEIDNETLNETYVWELNK